MKYNFSNYKKIYIYILLFVFITGFVLSSALPVFADGVSDYPVLSDLYEFNDGILYSDDIDGEKPKHMLTNDTQDTSLVSFFTEFMNLGCPINPLWYEQQIYKDTTTYPCYLFVSDGSDHITFVQLPENSFIVDAQIDATNNFYANKSFYIYSPTNITDHCVGINSSYNDSYYEFSYKGTTTIDGETLYYAFEVSNVSRSSNYILNTNMPIHVNNDEYNQMIDSMDDVSSDINYGNSDVNKENIKNHLTLKDDTKFYISNSSFNTGNLYIYPVFDKTQLDENETLNQYYLRLTGSVSTNTTYNSGSTQYKAKVNGKRVTTYFPMTNGGSNIYNFSLGSSGGSYYDIPLSSVNNGKYEMSFSQLHKLFYGSGSNDNNYELLARGYDSLYGGTSYFESVSNFIGGISVKGFNYNPQTSADIDIVPTKVHYHLDLYVVKKNLDEESISDVQSYIDGDLCDGNGISGENVNTSSDEDIMNALGTDYVPNEYISPETNTDYADTYNNVGGSSSSSSGGNSVSPSITGGNNNIVITNNNTNNGSGSGNSTSESSLVGSTIVTTLIKYIAGNKSSSVSYIEDIAGTNTYLQIVSNYMSFVPTEIWSLVVTCFSVCIGVVVVAFIISIVIKIIT